jgi:hypothetical protein
VFNFSPLFPILLHKFIKERGEKVKNKSIMKCMLLALLLALIVFVWSSAALAAACSGSAHISLSNFDDPSSYPLHVGDVQQWKVFIGNDCFANGDPNQKVNAIFVANKDLCGTSDVKVVMAFGEAGTFQFQGCDVLDPNVVFCGLDTTDLSGNTVLIKTNCSPGIQLTAGQVEPMAIIKAKVLELPPGNSTTTVGTATLVPGFGPMKTNDSNCDTQEYAGAEGTITVPFEARPCIHVTKSVEPLKTKPTDGVGYHIEVCNCGDTALTGVTVNDTILGNLVPSYFPATLAIGQCVSKDIPWTIPSNANVTVPYVNQVTVNSSQTAESCLDCTGASCVPCTTVAQASVELFKPDVSISKNCNCQESDPSIGCQVGDDVKYTITVTNNSTTNTPSIACTVKDSLLSVDKNFTWSTSSGQVNTTNKPRTITEGDPECVTNTANLHCTIEGFPNVIDKNANCTVCTETPSSSGAEEPYKAAVENDKDVPSFYISPKLSQFTHYDTWYYEGCNDVLSPFDPRVNPKKCKIDGGVAICPSRCSERFDSKTVENQPEVCCTSKTVADTVPDQNFVHCPDTKTALTTAGNSGWYEWVIALPKKPVGEMNIEIECGVLKPNAWKFNEYEAIEKCAAETGEPIASGLCVRTAKGLLKSGALPKIEVIAHPGCQWESDRFTPFHLTSYRNPGTYVVKKSGGHIVNNDATQVLDGKYQTRIALKPCMEKTILIKWPIDGTLNALGETEANLEPGDLIKVRMEIPVGNTVDVYCSKYSVLIGGIGEPDTLLKDSDCGCISDPNCQF